MSASSSPSDFACVRDRDVARARRARRRGGLRGGRERARGARERRRHPAPRLRAGRARPKRCARPRAAPTPTRRSRAPRPVVARDWPETWKDGLAPIVISPRLVVRPPFAAHALAPGQCEVVIEPRQAFGTGAHGSTALALALLDARLATARPARVLDVGSGSGVLAIAALQLGAGRALACDLDPIAARETRENAARNGVAARLAALRRIARRARPARRRFDLVIANVISSELRPILAALVARVAPRRRRDLLGTARERTRRDRRGAREPRPARARCARAAATPLSRVASRSASGERP